MTDTPDKTPHGLREAVAALADRWEAGAQRWATPLPVPPEVDELRTLLAEHPTEAVSVTTADALDALPTGSVIRDTDGWLWQVHTPGEWQCGGSYGRPVPTARLVEIGYLPFEVLYIPTAGPGESDVR
jgi:hypothetical protein